MLAASLATSVSSGFIRESLKESKVEEDSHIYLMQVRSDWVHPSGTLKLPTDRLEENQPSPEAGRKTAKVLPSKGTGHVGPIILRKYGVGEIGEIERWNGSCTVERHMKEERQM